MNYVEEHKKVGYKRYVLWILFFIYLLGLAYSVSKHELWGDEIHSWNIARNSEGITDLIQNTRYEGHPPVWYVLLFSLSRFTHNPWAIQFLQFGICVLLAFVFLFRTSLPLIYKALILPGYYFSYEYTVFSRNYAIGVLFVFLACLAIAGSFKYKLLLYYLLLFLLANCHFLGFIMAGSLHVYFLQPFFSSGEQRNKGLLHGFCGIIILLPALYFIFPPSNSGLGMDFWFSSLSKEQLSIVFQAPLKALSPVAAWWDYHSWNTQAFIQAQKTLPVLKFINPFISLLLLGSASYILVKDKRALLFFLVNLALTLVFALVFPLITARYVGFIFIGFVIALSLSKDRFSFSLGRRILLCVLLVLQITGAWIALKKDWQLPFSHAGDIKTIVNLVPGNSPVVTDYNILNCFSAFLDKPAYCLEFNQEKSFLFWDEELVKRVNEPFVYSKNLKTYFHSTGQKQVYFITNLPEENLMKRDSLFFKMKPVYIAGMNDAIEKYSNIYLYRISSSEN